MVAGRVHYLHYLAHNQKICSGNGQQATNTTGHKTYREGISCKSKVSLGRNGNRLEKKVLTLLLQSFQNFRSKTFMLHSYCQHNQLCEHDRSHCAKNKGMSLNIILSKLKLCYFSLNHLRITLTKHQLRT